MNINDVLLICKGEPWQIIFDRLRIEDDLRIYCPITYAYHRVTGGYIGTDSWQTAAIKMMLSLEDASRIVHLADYEPCELLDMIQAAKGIET